MILLLTGTAWGLDGNDALVLQLAGDVVISGTFLRAEPDQIWLSSAEDSEIIAVPLILLENATINGAPVSLEQIHSEAAQSWETVRVLVGDQGWAPHPIPVSGASLLFAGAGHAMLGDGRAAGGYAAVESVLLGTIALNVALEDPRSLPALIAVDVLLKIYAAQESARMARRKREIAEIRHIEVNSP
jgi:hypothetical protein